jgi:hypothetical protein
VQGYVPKALALRISEYKHYNVTTEFVAICGT